MLIIIGGPLACGISTGETNCIMVPAVVIIAAVAGGATAWAVEPVDGSACGGTASRTAVVGLLLW